MSEKKQSYLEKQLEAVVTKEQNVVTFTFQREKIKLDHPLEMEMLKISDPSIEKEITLTEAELRLIIQPPSSYISFKQLKRKDEKSRWIFASQLVKKVENHAYWNQKSHLNFLYLISFSNWFSFSKNLIDANFFCYCCCSTPIITRYHDT